MSVFLQRPTTEHVASNALAFAIRDAFPVSPGHTLIVPRRAVATWFEATREEQLAIFELVDEVKQALDAELHPAGYNVGFNAGAPAGQTVMHLHVHLIPRYMGDMDDPRGGVRHVIPGKGNYLAPGFRSAEPRSRARALTTGGLDDPFIEHIRPLVAEATDIAILAAFAMHQGVAELESSLLAAAARGARVRVIVGDYLNITQRAALFAMLGWMANEPVEGAVTPQIRVVEARNLPTPSKSFHPKSWRFEGPGFGVAFVGSSNLSRAALRDGIEWNLRLERERDPDGYARVAQAFEVCWALARPLDTAFLRDYRDRRPLSLFATPAEFAVESVEPAPEPHEIQEQALAHLALARSAGRQRALVVMATGLGKTWLAAFDVLRVAADLGRTPRVLFVAHRGELLRQAAKTLGLAFPEATPGFFVGDQGDLDAQFVFASVQKLWLAPNRARLRQMRFDYAVIDEAHHGTAQSYIDILDDLRATFILGLTATPDRTDQADVEGLFDDHVAFRADISVGIQSGRLAPFHYFGVKDTADYAHIPWRNGRFDAAALEIAVETHARMEKAWEGWQAHPATRTLIFCCTIPHARFVAKWLSERGVRVVAVHSESDSADRVTALDRLASGDLDAVCAVDLFNEGIDVPLVDRVLMLRPSESPVVFLQQLGRGLRSAPGKVALTVIDFVGNHRVFLQRLRTLLETAPAAGGAQVPVERWLREADRRAQTELPPGCSVNLELEAIDLLASLLPKGDKNEVASAFRQFQVEQGRRPTAGDLFRRGVDLRGKGASNWFAFVAREGQLNAEEQQIVDTMGLFLADLGTTPMTKCYKLVTLQALIEAGALHEGLSLDELCWRSHAILLRSPELARDLHGVRALADPRNPDPTAWREYWRRNPVAAWLGETSAKDKRRWFELTGDRFTPFFAITEQLRDTAAAMVAELVDWRLAEYRRRDFPTPVASTANADATVLPFVPRVPVRALPSLRVAAGWTQTTHDGVDLEPNETVWLRGPLPADVLAVRASGLSMAGWKSEIQDGDWLVIRLLTGVGLGAVEGRIAIIARGPAEALSFHVKRVVRDAQGHWWLRSDNPEVEAIEAQEGDRVVGEVVAVVPASDQDRVEPVLAE